MATKAIPMKAKTLKAELTRLHNVVRAVNAERLRFASIIDCHMNHHTDCTKALCMHAYEASDNCSYVLRELDGAIYALRYALGLLRPSYLGYTHATILPFANFCDMLMLSTKRALGVCDRRRRKPPLAHLFEPKR